MSVIEDLIIQLVKYKANGVLGLTKNGNVYEYSYDKKKKVYFWKLRLGSPKYYSPDSMADVLEKVDPKKHSHLA